MSQLPPPDEGPPPLAYGQFGPQPDTGQPDPPQPVVPVSTSAAAIASLVLGILGCVPVITGLLAVVLGIVGIRSTRNPDVRGRGLAIAGLILGGVSLLGWVGLGSLGGYVWVATTPDRTTARQFAQALAGGDVTKATAACQPGVTAAMLQPSIDYLKPDGALQDTTVVGLNLDASTGTGAVATITVQLRYPSTTKTAVVTLTAGPGRTRLVQSWQLQ